MGQIEIYIDEDAMDSDLVAALRSRGIPVITPLDAGLDGMPDEEQLAFATTRGSVLYAVPGRRAIAPRLASSRGRDDRQHAESGRIP